jgi:hypothetical protein
MSESSSEKSSTGQIVAGSIVLGVGILFLMVNLDLIPSLEDTWPIFVIIAGLAFIIGGLVQKKKPEEIDKN